MAITFEKNQGIRLALASAVPTPLHQSREAGGYYKVRSYHGGGEFFQQENAQLILQCLGDFLPRATERAGPDGRMEIFYQHLVSGQDVCSRTAPLDSGVNVPASELKRLEAAIALLKAKENDPATDPTKREIIRAFRLPSPQKDPELYRLYGSGANRRLLVLWGVEKEAGSSLSPQEALHRVPQTKSSIPWWVWLLLALLLLALLGWWWGTQYPQSAIGELLPSKSSPSHILVIEPERSSADSLKGTSPGNSATNSPTGSPALAGSQPGESAPKTAMPGSPSNPKKGAPAASSPIGGGTPDSSKKGESPSSMPVGSNPQSPSTLTSRRSTTLTDDPKKPEDPKSQPKAADASKARDSKKTEPAKLGEPPAPMTTAATPPSDSKKSEPGKPGEPPPSSKPTVASQPPPSASPKTPADTPAPKPAMASNSPKDTESPLPSTPISSPKPAAQSVMPLSAEIVNARTSAAPKDGKVEMQLSALARDPDGKAITISKVEGWTVDGKPQLDDAGRPITTNGLPVNLAEGVHRVRVTGTAADGRPVAAEAEVNVGIAVREESTVRLKQVSRP